jgi:glycosyltransferase involved in cell wall biosynthesis
MRIAQVAPLYERVPPKRYGGIERVVSYLTEEFVQQGHDVCLFASGDSITRAELVACCPKAIRDFEQWVDPIAYHALQLNQLFEREFDVVHFHIEYLGFPFARMLTQPSVTTLHGPLPELPELFRAFGDLPFVSVSDAQRAPFPHLNWRKTIYHGLPRQLYTFVDEPGEYLVFLGRVAPEKRCDRAIAIAKAAGVPLKIAAKIDPYDQQYFYTAIKPLLNDPAVEFLGEVDEQRKNRLLGGALAVLFPIDWQEPFGLVMIESLACGTPVIAYPGGSVPEIIKDGVTGFIVDSIDDAVEAVKRVTSIERRRCRQAFEERFTAARMARDYAEVYSDLVEANNNSIAKITANTSIEA